MENGKWKIHSLIFLAAFTISACSATSAKESSTLSISEDDLRRVSTEPTQNLPWAGKPLPAKSAPKKSGSPDQESPVDLNAGDLIIKANGPFKREEKVDNTTGAPVTKEWLTITKDVEIELAQSVLRGQSVLVVRDLKSGETELLEVKGGVELVDPERIGRGEMMRFEMQKSSTGEVIKNQFILVGDLPNQKKATLWLKKDPNDPSKNDVIQALRFFRDSRADTFRASGAPSAVLTIAAPVGAPAASASGKGSGLGSMDLSGGGKISINCEAEIFFDGATGKLKIMRNAVLIKQGANPGEGVKMSGDNAIITLAVPPPGLPSSSAGAFSGDLQMVECIGRVEIKSGTRTILCDKMRIDMAKKFLFMEMTNPTETVNVYSQSSAAGGEVIIAPKTLKMNLDTQELEAGGPLKTKAFTGSAPSNRGTGQTAEEALKAPATPPKKAF